MAARPRSRATANHLRRSDVFGGDGLARGIRSRRSSEAGFARCVCAVGVGSHERGESGWARAHAIGLHGAQTTILDLMDFGGVSGVRGWMVSGMTEITVDDARQDSEWTLGRR